MGRKRTPTAILKLSGSTTPRLKLGDDIQLPQAEIVCPEHLDALARGEFERVRALLEPVAALGAADVAVLAAYACEFSRWAQAQEQIDKEGMVTTTPNGLTQVSPWVTISRTAAAAMVKMASELGLSPTSRSKVSKLTAGKVDAFEAWMAKYSDKGTA